MGDARHRTRRTLQAAFQRRLSAFNQALDDDDVISDETRNELRTDESGGNLSVNTISGRESLLKKARLGLDKKFKSRQFLQEQRKLIKDRPGRSGTLLGSFGGGKANGGIA